MANRRMYANPPIEEVVCEFVFPGQDWDPTVTGRLYERLKDDYPAKPEQVQLVEVKVEDAGSQQSIGLQQDNNKVKFSTNDNQKFVHIGKNVISAHTVKPYIGWDNYRAQIKTLVCKYADLVEPAMINRIGMRYINRLLIQSDSLDLSDYLTAPPQIPVENFPTPVSAFLTRVESSYQDMPIRLRYTCANTVAPEGVAGILLDIDVIWEQNETEFSVESVMEVVESLRDRERIVFESLIKEKARSLFDES